MKIIIKNFLFAAVLYFSSSCAMALNSKTVDVTIDSNPSGADIIIEGKNYGRTPATINIEPKNYEVLLTKEGYGSTKIKLESWQAIRTKEGEGARCLADATGAMLLLPMFSYLSVYCRDFKEPRYSANIPHSAAPRAIRQNAPPSRYQSPYQQNSGEQYQNYYQPYGNNGYESQDQQY